MRRGSRNRPAMRIVTSRLAGPVTCLALLAASALPVTAQIVVIPLDPVDPGEVVTPDEPQDDPDDFTLTPLEPRDPGSVVGGEVTTTEEDEVTQGTGAMLRGLDKLAGTTVDIPLAKGETGGLGWLQITLGECRYPVDNPAGDAYAWLVIRENNAEVPIFEGWMIASSPALSALDHSRFDVWVKSCTTD